MALLYTLWADWIQVFEYDDRDELTDAMLDAGDCFQASVFDSLHGFYRSSISNLRSVIDVVAVGTLGKLSPKDDAYQKWTEGKSGSSLNFLNLRSRLSKSRCAIVIGVKAVFGVDPSGRSGTDAITLPRNDRRPKQSFDTGFIRCFAIRASLSGRWRALMSACPFSWRCGRAVAVVRRQKPFRGGAVTRKLPVRRRGFG